MSLLPSLAFSQPSFLRRLRTSVLPSLLFTFYFLLLTCVAGVVCQANIAINADTVISTPASPTPSVTYAAKELAKYLGKITGAEFQIVTNVPVSAAVIRVNFFKPEFTDRELRVVLAEGLTLF